MPACPACSATLETLVACQGCGRLLAVPAGATPFEILGLEPSQALDAQDLRQRLLRAGRRVHPDFFATAAPEQRALAERNSALLNGVREVLVDDARRADWLVAHLGGPGEEQERAMPPKFLAEVLEWNELLESARAGAVDVGAVVALEGQLREVRRQALAAVAGLLSPLPARGAAALRQVRRELNCVRYVDRALSEIEALRLARPSAH